MMLEDIKNKAQSWWTERKNVDAWTYHKLAKTHLETQDWQAAIDACQQAITHNPECAWFYDTLGKAQQQQGNDDEAIAAFQQAIQRDGTVSWFHYELGRCLVKQGDWEAAVTAFERSIELKSDFEWAYFELGEVLLDLDRAEQAVIAFEQATNLNAKEPLFRQKLEYAQHVSAQQPMTLATLLKHPPKLHRVFGKSGSLGISDAVLHFLDHHVSDATRTLETGAGISTLLFAIKGAKHTCIVPDAELVDRIQAFCQRHQISTQNITFHIARSEAILPQLALELDLVLIDGRHAFPSPFIDWYYTTNFLQVGGTMIVDDTQLWTGDVLNNFLKLEPEWELIEELPKDSPNTAIFKKLQDGSHDKWWLQQPYAIQQSPHSVERLAK